ncbi:MAG: HNH endonuclease, partial [Chloroflexi bacterium]|nr:HNH endonuclease [Chloroflexota bacterium]
APNENSEMGKKLSRNYLSPVERRMVINEFDGRCYVCKSTENLTIHHILERQFGGGTEVQNSVPLCRKCHDKVHNREIDRWTLEILRYRQRYANLKKQTPQN